MSKSVNRPKRTGTGDVFSAFILIMSIAIGLQAYSDINKYAELRRNGSVIEGYWAGSFTNPSDDEFYGIYYFTVDDKAYNAQQILPSSIDYTASGDAISIIYLPGNPNTSRISGTEGYNVRSVVTLVICVLVAVFSFQYIVAYYTARSAWILQLRILAIRFVSN